VARAPARGSRSRRRRRRPRRQSRRLGIQRAALALAAGGFAFGIVAGGWAVDLDRIVRARFEGRVFRLPSRVYSAPAILYPGLNLKLIDLRGTLQRLGYREESAGLELQPGGYLWRHNRLQLYLRAFKHPTRPEPARQIELEVEQGQIETLRSLTTGRELGAVMLEPEIVGSYYGLNREQRELVRVEELPRHLIAAVLAVEDQRFEKHHGIDWRRVLGAFWANLRSGSIRQGGSTLTQQLVKNFFLTPERTFRRKAQEAVMALLVEARYSKREILETYLNEIYLGQRGATSVHGVGEAARFYFGKRPKDLSAADSALLAAIIQSPNGISPFRDPERARARRDLVLALMWQQGRLDTDGFERARAEPLRLAPVSIEPREAPYFLDVLRRQLPLLYDAEALTSEGLRIYSTLDLRLQQRATKALREGLAALERSYPWLKEDDPERTLQGCLVALRPQTGEILVLVGGRDYRLSQFDRCTQARRPAGSVFKPFVYIAALEPRNGEPPLITLASRLDDSPLTVSTPAGPWSPENYDHEFHGEVSVREALERSLNVATARLGQEVGIERVAEVARRLGTSSDLPVVPSLAIGTADLSPIELARSYATLANGGIRPQVRSFEEVVDSDGKALERRSIAFERVLDPGVAYLGVSLLRGVVERGTARGLRRAGLAGPIAAKTGTSDEERDAWFVGFTPEFVTVVWIGFDEPGSLRLPASQVALPIWARFVMEATGGTVRGAFLPPRNVVPTSIDPETGALALRGCPRRQTEPFLDGTQPTETCPEGAARAEDEQRDGTLFGRFLERLLRGPP
jgi:penicillin-binding protein 1B